MEEIKDNLFHFLVFKLACIEDKNGFPYIFLYVHIVGAVY